jgi:hypothetical protein
MLSPEEIELLSMLIGHRQISIRKDGELLRRRAVKRKSALDLLADSIFANKEAGEIQEKQKLAVAQIIECRNDAVVRKWLEMATQENLTALVEQMISTTDGTNEQTVLDWAKSQKRRFSVIQ